MIRTKSVHSPIDRKSDGLRILATRFTGHRMPSSRYDVWMANLAPSEQLLRQFQGGKITWSEFGRRYRAELREQGPIDRKNQTIKNHGQKFTLRLVQKLGRQQRITLMCHCDDDEPHCHLRVLTRLLAKEIT